MTSFDTSAVTETAGALRPVHAKGALTMRLIRQADAAPLDKRRFRIDFPGDEWPWYGRELADGSCEVHSPGQSWLVAEFIDIDGIRSLAGASVDWWEA